MMREFVDGKSQEGERERETLKLLRTMTQRKAGWEVAGCRIQDTGEEILVFMAGTPPLSDIGEKV